MPADLREGSAGPACSWRTPGVRPVSRARPAWWWPRYWRRCTGSSRRRGEELVGGLGVHPTAQQDGRERPDSIRRFPSPAIPDSSRFGGLWFQCRWVRKWRNPLGFNVPAGSSQISTLPGFESSAGGYLACGLPKGPPADFASLPGGFGGTREKTAGPWLGPASAGLSPAGRARGRSVNVPRFMVPDGCETQVRVRAPRPSGDPLALRDEAVIDRGCPAR